MRLAAGGEGAAARAQLALAGRLLARRHQSRGVVVTVLPVLRAGELSTIVRSARVTHALCDARFLDDLTAAADQLGDRAPSVLVYGGGADSDLTARVDAHPPDFTAVPTAADDACMIAYTSGTTGAPKGCVHFHRDVLAIADTYSAQVLKPTPDDLFVGNPPFAFTFGLGGLLIFPMRAGAATVLLERPRPEAILDAVSEHGASVVFTAPTAYRSMLTQLEGATCPPCAAASPPGNTCPPPPGRPGTTPPACACSTASAPPRCCTSSSPPATSTCAPAPPDAPCPGSRR